MHRDVAVHDHPERQRFEWLIDGQCAIVTYQREGRTLWLNHVGVPAALAGRGIASTLVEAVLQQIRARGERIVPVCSFVVHYLERHPADRDLVLTAGAAPDAADD